jgi:hypothetical protein
MRQLSLALLGLLVSGAAGAPPQCGILPLAPDSAERTAPIEALRRQGPALAGAFTPHVLRNAKGGRMPYRLSTPARVKSGRSYPLVVFLHGAAGSGTDNVKQLQGANVFGALVWTLPENQKRPPAFVLAPQSDVNWACTIYDPENPPKTLADVKWCPPESLGLSADLALQLIDIPRDDSGTPEGGRPAAEHGVRQTRPQCLHVGLHGAGTRRMDVRPEPLTPLPVIVGSWRTRETPQAPRRTRPEARLRQGHLEGETLMRRVGLSFIVLLLIGVVALAAQGQDKPAAVKMSAVLDTPEWQMLKALVGSWDGFMQAGADKMPATADVRMTGDGSAIMHVLGWDTPYEMVTMIHRKNQEELGQRRQHPNHVCVVTRYEDVNSLRGADRAVEIGGHPAGKQVTCPVSVEQPAHTKDTVIGTKGLFGHVSAACTRQTSERFGRTA